MIDFIRAQPEVLLLTAALLLLAAEVGYRAGRWRLARIDEAARQQVQALQGAIFGLLALLLAFTFAMAAQRFDARKQLVLDEANAIGTTYLRADFLPEPLRTDLQWQLRAYVDARLAYVAAGVDPQALRAALGNAHALQAQLWSGAAAAVRDGQPPNAAVSFAESLNEVIDLDAKRLAALENHVPSVIWALLIGIAVLTTFTSGFTTALGGHRVGLAMLLVPVVVATVITVTVDLDRPRRGLIKISQQSMENLRDALAVPRVGP